MYGVSQKKKNCLDSVCIPQALCNKPNPISLLDGGGQAGPLLSYFMYLLSQKAEKPAKILILNSLF